MMQTLVERWQRALAEQGVRLTPQRDAILKFLAETRIHPTAAEVYTAVREKFPHISRATVYNTLNLMVRLGLIAELRREEGALRYETHLEPHINLICIRCGRVEDVELSHDVLATLEQRLPETRKIEPNEVDLGEFKVLYARVDVYGYCAECWREMQTEQAQRTESEKEKEVIAL